ncbi:hypothetical protein AB0H73_14690 [Streptomyces olivoreticuli]
MPVSKGAPPSESAPPDRETPAEPVAPAPAVEPLPGRLAPGPAEYTAPFASVYDVPLTARPARESGPATVFDWPEGAPADGRWIPTRKKPNQVADNDVAAPVTPPEV